MLGAEIFFGEDLPLKEKGYFQAGQVTIKPERKLDLHADGGYTGASLCTDWAYPAEAAMIVPA